MAKKKQKENKSGKNLNVQTKKNPNVVSDQKQKDNKDLIYILIALAITLVCFLAVRDFNFVNWDDDKNFYENEFITSLNKENFWANTKQIFQQKIIGNYNPLTTWTFLLDQKIYGLEQTGSWHMTNVYLHMICVLFVFLIGRRLGLQAISALLLAILFGIHPMRVESVAWVTERKDVLFGAFYLAAIWNYLRYKMEDKGRYMVYVYVLFILSLFSKIQAVSLPLSLIAIDYFRSGKFEMSTALKKAPMFLMSLAFGLAGIYFLKDEGSLGSESVNYPFWQRIFVGSFGLMIYYIKAIFPWKMSPLYPYESTFPAYYYATGLVYLITGAGLFYAWKKNMKAVVFGLVFFLVNIVFLLQILGAGQGLAADRFTYIAYFGFFFIAAYYFEKGYNSPKFKNIALGVAAVFCLLYAVMTINQTKVWKNSGTLWTHVLKYYDKTTLPWGNRANYHRSIGELELALADYDKAITLKPSGQTFNSRARLFFDKGSTRDTLMMALADYNKAIELEPENGEFLINRGATYARLGDPQKAIADLDLGLKYKPDHATGYLNRSVLNNMQGNIQAALDDLEIYVKYFPYRADIWYEMGRAKRTLGKHVEALPLYNRAIELNPNNGLFYYERSRTNALLNNIPQAKTDLQSAISAGYNKIDPQYQQMLMSQ